MLLIFWNWMASRFDVGRFSADSSVANWILLETSAISTHPYFTHAIRCLGLGLGDEAKQISKVYEFLRF